MRVLKILAAVTVFGFGCAKQTDGLEEPGYSAGARTGGAGGAGGKAAGGSAGKAGAGAATGGSSSGGSGATAASGGQPSAGTGGSEAGSGGDAGATNGEGGESACGDAGTPSITGVSARYESEQDAASTTTVGAQIVIYNSSAETIDLADITVHYYTLNEVDATLDKDINWAWLRPNSSGGQTDLDPKVTFAVVAAPSCEPALSDLYFEFGFAADAGSLPPDHHVIFSWYASNGASQNFEQSNDYSFSTSQTVSMDHAKLVIRYGAEVIWGTQP